MSQKSYSPLQIRNPTSLQHLAVIKPGQGFELHLDHDMYPGEVRVEISSDHLVLDAQRICQNRAIYSFKHDLFVSDWAEFSQSMLGEIWVDAKDMLAKVLVVMECLNSEKMKNLTVVNPDCYDVRIKPYTIMEVVLCDEDFSGNDEWNWEWCPTIDLEIEEIGYESLNLYTWNQFASYDMDSPEYIFARHPRIEVGRDVQPWTKQHHFWFRFNNSVLDIMDKNFGVNRVGDLKFTGYSNRYKKPNCDTSCHSMSVYVDLRSKFKTKVLDTLHLKDRDGTPPVATSASSTGSVIALTHKPKTKKKKKRHWEETLPLKREVTINKIPFASLEEGCKVLSCSPEMDQIPDDDPYGHDYHDFGDCDDYCRGSSGLWKRLYQGTVHGRGRPHWD